MNFRFLKSLLLACLLLPIIGGQAWAALATSTYLQVMSGGSDTANGGGFNVLNANFPTDGSWTAGNTSAPVFSSSSYNFVAGDVGARIYLPGIGSGAGGYTVASVASNKATLNAAIGSATLKGGFLNTVVGISSSATGASATWGIDYSQMTSARLSFTDLTVGSTTTQFTSSGNPVGKNFVGNLVIIISTVSGTPTAGRYEVVSTSGTTATCDRALGTAASVANAGLGGALASPGGASAVRTTVSSGGMPVLVQAATYTCTSSSSNVAAGLINDTNNPGSVTYPFTWEGYSTVAGDGRQQPPAGTPIISAGSLTSITVVTLGASATTQSICNFTIDANNGTANVGIALSSANAFRVNVKNCKGTGFNCNGIDYLYRCTATGCSGATTQPGIIVSGQAFECEAYSNTTIGIKVVASSSATRCLSYNNSGATSTGFTCSATSNVFNSVAYGNGSHGFSDTSASAIAGTWQNCIAEANGGFGFQASANNASRYLLSCATCNNTSGATSNLPYQENPITVSGAVSVFKNAAGLDFSLNNTVNRGRLLRRAGYPGSFPHASSTGYVDIGAVQSVPPLIIGGK
jgi:hypothetical protein